MEFSYKTKGVCSRGILIDVEDGILKSVRFDGGCSGNSSDKRRIRGRNGGWSSPG